MITGLVTGGLKGIIRRKSANITSMDKLAEIMSAAQILRQLFGCAYGNCYSASVLLIALLKKSGLKAKIIKGTFQTDLPPNWSEDQETGGKATHFWVVCNGYLLDVTADQFNDEIEGEQMPEIICVPVKQNNSRYSDGRIISQIKNPCSPLVALSTIQADQKKRDVKKTLKELGLSLHNV